MPDLELRRLSLCGRAIRARVRVAVAVTDEAVDRIQQVAATCRALGFEHDSTLGGIGVLTGSAKFEDLSKLRAVPGVLAVETERSRPDYGPFRQRLGQSRARRR